MATERCITCYLPVTDGEACPCGCGRPVCSSCGAPRRMTEPTATQLYNAVKALRAANGHRVLTIPEINSVLVARAEYTAGVAAGPQATPDRVAEALAHGRTEALRWAVRGFLSSWADCTPPADLANYLAKDIERMRERVRVVAAPTSQDQT